MNEPRVSSTDSLEIRGTWKSSITVLTSWVLTAWAAAFSAGPCPPARGGVQKFVYFEYSSTMSCSATGAAISRRSGLRRTLAVSESWSACSHAGTCPVSSVASRIT